MTIQDKTTLHLLHQFSWRMYDMVIELFDNKLIYQPPNIRDLLDDLDGVYMWPQLDVYKPTNFIVNNVNDLKDNINTQAFKEEMTKPFIHEDMPLPDPPNTPISH